MARADEAADNEDLFDLIGHVIDDEKISIKSVVGMGGFSVVYEGWHHVFDERVAIKCLKVPAGFTKAQTSEYFANFRREGQLLLKLAKSTQNVVRIFNMGEITRPGTPSIPYLVLEWLDGEGLDLWFTRRRQRGAHRLSLLEVTTLLDAGAEALAKAHAIGVAHRDVKPPNFHVTEAGSVKLIDFGISKQFDVNASRFETQTAAGPAYTPSYGAPEQFARDLERGRADLPATGPHTDVFALALVCVELLSGAAPLGADESRIALYGEATRRDRRPTPRTRGAEVTNEVEAVFQRALAVEITERYPSVADFWRALHDAAGLSAPAWMPASKVAPRERSSTPASSTPASAPHASAPPRPGHRRSAPEPVPQLKTPESRLSSAPAPAAHPSKTVPMPPPPARAHRVWPWLVGGVVVASLSAGTLVALSEHPAPRSVEREAGRAPHAAPPGSSRGAWGAGSATRRALTCDRDSACGDGKHCCHGACRECCPDVQAHCPPGSLCSAAEGYVCVLP